MTGADGPRAGRAVVTVSIRDWSSRAVVGAPLEPPIDLAMNPSHEALYVVDFGHFEVGPHGWLGAKPGTGGHWRVG